MKILVIAAAFGLTASAAMADCAGHKPVNASVDVDRTITTASVQPQQTQVQSTDTQLPPPVASDAAKAETVSQ